MNSESQPTENSSGWLGFFRGGRQPSGQRRGSALGRMLVRWSMPICAVAACLVCNWYSTSVIDFDEAAPTSFRRTGIFFWLGFPVLLQAAVYAAIFAGVARGFGRPVAWISLMIVSSLLIRSSISDSPTTRLERMIGQQAAAVATIHRLQVSESFGDGTAARGVISGPHDLLEQIISYRTLTLDQSGSTDVVQWYEKEIVLPTSGDVYSDERVKFFQDPRTGKIYFQQFFEPH